ncbi:MAG: DUF177 domain-containing protein [Acidimicrobiia bacterium]|nr:DUF177 domain-containing protein [Acidimicrobiia bacterium]
MPDPLRPLRVNAAELLRQPGATSRIEARLEADALGIDHPALDGDIDVAIDLDVLDDGIIAVGAVSARWASGCRRCLRDLNEVLVIEVDELHQIEVTDPDAFAIENRRLDLAPMVRESVLLELAADRLCRRDCAGLCPECGIDLNDGACGCDTEVVDDRWAALDALVVDED